MTATTKTAKVHWQGDYISVIDADAPHNELFFLSTSHRDLVDRVLSKTAALGYSVPQIYAGKDGTTRIWF